MTKSGLVNLTRGMADTLKRQINQGYVDQEVIEVREEMAATWCEKPKEDVHALGEWERRHGLADDSD